MYAVEGKNTYLKTQLKLWQQNRNLKSKHEAETKYEIKEDLHLFHPSSKRKGH